MQEIQVHLYCTLEPRANTRLIETKKGSGKPQKTPTADDNDTTNTTVRDCTHPDANRSRLLAPSSARLCQLPNKKREARPARAAHPRFMVHGCGGRKGESRVGEREGEGGGDEGIGIVWRKGLRLTFAFLTLHFSHACAVRRRGCSGDR